MRYDGMFGFYHLLFLFLTVIIASITIYIFYTRLKKDEYKKALGLKIIAAIWLCFAIAHQVVYAYETVVLKIGGNPKGWQFWQMLIPFTYCSLLSFITPIVIILFKKNNRALHCLTYFCFFGGFSIFCPTWLKDDISFFLPSSILAMFHHAFMFVMSVLLIMTKYVKPSMKRFYIYPVGVGMIILLGVFEKYALDFPDGMMIGTPLFDKMPHLTSWWGLWIAGSFLVFTFIFLYEFIVYKKRAHEIFDVSHIFDDTLIKKIKEKKASNKKK